MQTKHLSLFHIYIYTEYIREKDFLSSITARFRATSRGLSNTLRTDVSTVYCSFMELGYGSVIKYDFTLHGGNPE